VIWSLVNHKKLSKLPTRKIVVSFKEKRVSRNFVSENLPAYTYEEMAIMAIGLGNCE
jgi:hypothetical protein